MGLAVRRTRPQSRITAAPVQDPNYSGPKSRNSGCSAVQLRAQSPAVGNGIFGCRDRAPKIITKKRQRLQRPKSGKKVARNPRRSALFGVDSGQGGLRRLDGGVRSHIRTGLEPESPDNCLFTGYFHEFGPVMEKCTRIGRIFSMP